MDGSGRDSEEEDEEMEDGDGIQSWSSVIKTQGMVDSGGHRQTDGPDNIAHGNTHTRRM